MKEFKIGICNKNQIGIITEEKKTLTGKTKYIGYQLGESKLKEWSSTNPKFIGNIEEFLSLLHDKKFQILEEKNSF